MVLVTGASGFVGAALFEGLHEAGFEVRGAVRSLNAISSISEIGFLAIGNLGATTDLTSALMGVDCVIHCAARTHVMPEPEVDALAAYRTVNVDGSRRLAEQAATFGVRRLIFLSSIKVNGESTDGLPGPFGARNDPGRLDVPAPEDPYGVSKWQAEQALWAVS